MRGHPDPAVSGRPALRGAHPRRAGRAARARRGPVLPARPVLVRALPAARRPRRVLVTGSRTWTSHGVIADALRGQFHPGTVLVTGGCPRGADAIAEQLWRSWGGQVERHPADWATGRAPGWPATPRWSPPAPDACLAFIHDNSPGASHTARLADLAGIPVHRYDHPGPEGQEQEKAPSGLTLEAAALGYIRRGWPVFVLGRSKRPVANCRACRAAGPGHDPAGCDCLTCHGFHAATTSPARLAAMLAAVPRGLLAIRTGTAAGLAVVDIDPRNGGQVDRALMTPTATVATGGGGWHLYYRHPGGPLLAALPGRAGVDVKADGGYVVAPPSVHPGTGRRVPVGGGAARNRDAPALGAALAPPPAAARPAPLSGPPADPPGGGHLITRGAAGRAPAGRARTPPRAAAGSRCTARPAASPAWSPPGPSPKPTPAPRSPRPGWPPQQTDRDIRAAIDGAFRDEGAAA